MKIAVQSPRRPWRPGRTKHWILCPLTLETGIIDLTAGLLTLPAVYRLQQSTVFTEETTVYAHWVYIDRPTDDDHLSGSDSSSDPSYRIDVDVITRGGNVSVRPTSASVGTRVARIVVMNWTGLSCLTRPELNLLSPSGTRIPTPLSCLTAAAALTLTLCEWRCPVPLMCSTMWLRVRGITMQSSM